MSASAALSRRSFVRLTMGAITLLPTVASEALLPAPAAADDADAANSAALTLGADATVYVVRTREIALVVRDVSLPLHTPNLVAGAHVTITSRYNGKAVDGTTDENGSIVFDIADLAEATGASEKPARYEFNATIEVTAPGYRIFRTGIYRAKGGVAIAVPTQPAQPGLPYPSSVSFDGWDALYTVDESVDFVSSSENDVSHAFTVALEDCPANAAVAAELFVDGSRYATANARANASGQATLDLSETFLLSSSAAALPIGDDHEYALRYKIGTTTYEVPVQLRVSEAPPEAQSAQLKKDLDLLPFNEGNMGLSVSIPEGFPLVGGTKVKLWQPSFPINLYYDPFGYIMVKATLFEVAYTRDSGEKDKAGWKINPRATATEQYNNQKKAMSDSFDKAIGALVAKDGAVRQIGFSSKLTFSTCLEFMAAATWSFQDKDSRGRAQLGLRVGANYSLSETFWAGPVPVIIRFGIGISLKAMAEVGYVSPSVWSFSQYRWDYSSTGFDLQIAIAPTLSLGVGISGVCSLSFKGSAALTFYLHTGPLPDGYESLPDPHLRLGAVAALNLELEFLFFTNSWTLWNDDWPNLYNNWDLKNALTEPALKSAAPPRLTMAESFNNATIIDEAALSRLVEFETAGADELNPQPFMPGRLTPLMASGDGDAAGALGDAADLEGTENLSAQATGWETEAATATRTGEHDYVSIPIQRPGVLRLGAEQGFVTTTDVRIAKNILSGSRFKFLSAGGRDWLVRICAVSVAGKVRTRVVAELVGGDERRVLDFKTREGRDDCFDYDFDIASTRVDGEDVINMVVISGTRPDGDATNLAQAAGQTFFSFLTCRDWDGAAGFAGSTIEASGLNAAGVTADSFPFRNYSCPQLRQIVKTYDGVEYGQAVVTFLERAAKFENALMGDDYDLTRTGVGLVFFSDLDQTIYVSGMDAIRAVVTRQVKDPSITEIALSQRAGGWHVLMLKGSEKTHYVLVETDACVRLISGKPVPLVLDAKLADLGDYADRIGRLIPVPAQGYFLTCLDGAIKRVDMVAGDAGAQLAFTDIEGADVNVDDFGVTSSGDVLFWPARREAGSGYVFDEDGEPVVADNPEVNLIMGARIRDGVVSRSMVLSEVGHPMHRIRSFDQSGSYLSFISTNTLDAASGQGELWYTSVPWVRCATLLSAEPYVTTLAVGDELPFYAMIRNDGNCYLSGVTLAVSEKGGPEIGRTRLDFAEGNTLESEWNPADENGQLTGVEYDWSLAPGATSLYWAEYVTIPEDWEGEKELEVKIVEVRSSGASLLRAGADEAETPEAIALDYLPDVAATSPVRVVDSKLNFGDGGAFTQADVEVVDDSGEGGGNGGDNGGSGNGNGGQGSGGNGGNGNSNGNGGQQQGNARGGGPTPDTGDDAARASNIAAGLALGGAAAALAAYGSSRLQSEKE